jgi:flagellar FliJ protein
MARFTFRLDPVLAHRKRLEEEQQIALAAALKRQADAEWLRDDYRSRRDAFRERIRTGHATMDATELRATYAHCAYLDRALVDQERVVTEMHRLAEIERTKLLARTRDRKVLETLRERRHETFVLEGIAAEQRETDEINARRFDRATFLTRETSS